MFNPWCNQNVNLFVQKMINDMDRKNIDTFVFEDPIAPLACSLQFSPLQKHNFISTSTDFLPQII